MKILCKRILAFALGLALTAAIAPAAAFATDGSGYEDAVPADDPVRSALDDDPPADLLEAFLKYLNETRDYHYRERDIALSKGYGWFDGCYLADMYIDPSGSFDDWMWVWIGGYVLRCYQMDGSMIFYKDGEIYSLFDAYETGLITEESLALAIDALNDAHYSFWEREGTVEYAIAIMRNAMYLFGKHTPLMVDKYDLDGDGAITVSDALVGLRVSAGIA